MSSMGLLRWRRFLKRNNAPASEIRDEPASATNSIFPLRLTPTELCWLLEDCPSHPIEFFLRLRFSGRLERNTLERALQTALARHPLLTAVVKHTAKRRWHWISSKGPPLAINWLPGPTHDDLPVTQPINIHRQPGLRVTVVEHEDHADIVLQFHHTVCDGLGASDFTGDVLTAYANLVNSDAQRRFKRLDPTRMETRETLELSGWQLFRWLLRHAVDVRRIRRFYKRKPRWIVPPWKWAEESPRNVYPESLFRCFSRDESVAIQRRAKETGTTVNSLLLRDMFQILHDWRREHEWACDGDTLRLTMPVSLRTAAHRTMPAANLVSLVCLERTADEARDAEALLRSIDAEIEEGKNDKRGLVFPLVLRLLQFWPSELAKGLRRKRFCGSVLLTNIGPALANCHLPRRDGKLNLGKLSLEQVNFLPVLRPGHCVTVGATIYAGMISLGMHYDSRTITSVQAREIFERLGCRFGNPAEA
jgi:NRPS condensation-like uncharacterized protein